MGSCMANRYTYIFLTAGLEFLEMAWISSAHPLSCLGAGSLTSSSTTFKFMHGGRYKFCYQPDASNTCTCTLGKCMCRKDYSECSPSSRPHGTCSLFPTVDTRYRTNLLFADILVTAPPGLMTNLESRGLQTLRHHKPHTQTSGN